MCRLQDGLLRVAEDGGTGRHLVLDSCLSSLPDSRCAVAIVLSLKATWIGGHFRSLRRNKESEQMDDISTLNRRKAPIHTVWNQQKNLYF